MKVFHTLHISDGYVSVALKGRKIRKIGDSGQTNHRNVHKLSLRIPAEPLGQAVLVVDVHMDIGDNPRHRYPAQLLQGFQPRLQNGPISPELVDHRALDPGAFLRFQQSHRAVKLGKDPAPVDVSHQKHRRIHHLGKAHIHDVLLLEVDFRRASRSLDDDDVIFRGQGFIGPHYLRHQLPLAPVILHGPHIAQNLAVHNHLTAHIGGGLQENGVHPYIRGNARGLRLNHLGTTHFSAVCGNKGIQRHILTFEGSHPVAVLPEHPAQTGAQQAFARIGHGTLNHNVFCHAHTSRQLPMAAISASFSSRRRTAIRYQPAVSPG